jgi:methyl-galactoside transport system substrate-binding protein
LKEEFKMRKILSVALACSMAFALAGCSGGTEETTAAATTTAAAAAEETTAAEAEAEAEATTAAAEAAAVDGNVGVFYYSYSDTYISSVRSAMDAKWDELGITYTDYDGNSTQTTQTEQVSTAITSGANLLVVNIVDTGSDDAAQNIVDQAKEKDIPVIFFNREVSDDVVNSYEKCVFIGTDAAEAGHMQGEMIANFLLEGDNYANTDLNGDGEISYVMFKGQEGNNEAIYRTQYSVEDADALLTEAGKSALKFYDDKNSNKYLVDQDGNWSAAAAQNYMTTILSEYSEANGNMIEMVICNNDGMAEGAIAALQTAGYNIGDGKVIPVFGVDATDAAKSLIANGQMTGTIKQDAEGMANGIVEAAQNGLAGNGLLDGMDSYIIDSEVDKVRIPYQIYLGEE